MAATRWGICCTGNICNDFCACLNILPTSEHQILAVAGSALEKAQKFADKFGLQKAYGSYNELANDPDIEIVYIGSVCGFHAKLCALFINAGKHVLCEATLCRNFDEVEKVIELAREKGVFLLEGNTPVFHPLLRKLPDYLGEIGGVQMVTSNIGHIISFPPERDCKMLGEGATIMAAPFLIPIINSLFGEFPHKVTAQCTVLSQGVDGSTCITLHYSEGRMAQLNISLVCDIGMSMIIAGPKGNIKIPGLIYSPDAIEVNGKEIKGDPLPKPAFDLIYPNMEYLVHEIKEVRKCLVEGKRESSIWPHQMTKDMARLIDDICKQMGIVYPDIHTV